MKKSIKFVAMTLLSAMMLISCGESKLGEAVDILNATPVFITDQKVDQKIEITDDAITVTFPDQGTLTDKNGNPVDDEMVVNAFFRDLFNSNITILVLAETMDTAKGGSPVEEFLSLAEKLNKVFLVEYKGKKYKLPVDLVRTILRSHEKVSLPRA